MITETAQAKINLTLKIRGRRPDGYHELVSLVTFAAVGDRVTLEPEAPFGIETNGPFASAIEGENLIGWACRLVREALPGVRIGRILLTKRLPVAAGLGGGSADAAAVLRALARSEPAMAGLDLHAIAARLGADVPVCLRQRPALMWGIGERLVGIPDLPSFWLVLANPGVPLATADVFTALRAPPLAIAPLPPEPPPSFATLDDLVGIMRDQGNDLQPVAVRLRPQIADVLAALRASRGCLVAALAGSGPTCFGIFAAEGPARIAADEMAAIRPDWWVVPSSAG